MPDTPTSFQNIYDVFLSSVTDDMYMELTEEDTKAMLQELLVQALPYFEFPRFDINNYTVADTTNKVEGTFNVHLTNEEINIIVKYMVVAWIGQQLSSIENTRMKYSGTDFKFTSQANHIAKLIALQDKYKTEGFHLQRLYKRRKFDTTLGVYRSTIPQIREEL